MARLVILNSGSGRHHYPIETARRAIGDFMLGLINAIKTFFSPSVLSCTGALAESDECASRNDPERVFDSLANGQHWNLGADLADVYGGAYVSPFPATTGSWGSIWTF